MSIRRTVPDAVTQRADFRRRICSIHELDPLPRPLDRPLLDARKLVMSLAVLTPQTAPLPQLGARNQVCAQGVSFDIATDREEMGIALHHKELEASLIEMAGSRRLRRWSVQRCVCVRVTSRM
jgi:hypothetical protein